MAKKDVYRKMMKKTYMGFSSDEELREIIKRASANKKVSGIHNSPIRKEGTSFWDFLKISEDDVLVAEALSYVKEP